MRARGPDERAVRLGWFLQNVIAANTSAVKDSIAERLAGANGYPTQTIGASPPIGMPTVSHKGDPCDEQNCDEERPCPNHEGATLTSVERSAHARLQLVGYLEGLNDRFEGLEVALRELDRYERMVLGRPTAEDVTQAVPMCRDNQLGREGAPEWGDALCPMPGTVTGLCGAHYQAARKYRLARGLRDTTTQAATDEHYPDGYRARGPRQDPAA